jgi:hypothetical protein
MGYDPINRLPACLSLGVQSKVSPMSGTMCYLCLRPLIESISWRDDFCCAAAFCSKFGNTWEQLIFEQSHSLSLRTHAGVPLNFKRRHHVRMPKLCLRDLQRSSLCVKQRAVCVTKPMPIHLRNSCAFAGWP